MAFRSDRKALRFVKADLLANAFLHSEVRKVDKVGCISFMGKKYEVGLAFIGMKVQVVYDPVDITELTIEYEGHPSWKARELVIGERAGVRPQLPDHMQRESADTSRLLRAAEPKHDQRKEKQTPAVSYRNVPKEVAEHV
jgi:putative transposase